MKRRPKNYKLAKPPEQLLGQPGNLIVNLLDASGVLVQSFDFTDHARRPKMAAELAFAFRHHLADKSKATRTNTFSSGVRSWFRFLDEHDRSGCAPMSMADIDEGTLNAFIAWLNRRPIGKGSRHTAWSSFKQIVAWLRRHCPDLVRRDLELPFNAFPRKNAEAKPREALSRTELDAILAAARADIDASWRTFQEGRNALERVDRRAIAAKTDPAEIDLDDLGVLLAIPTDRFGGLVPMQRVMREIGIGWWRLRSAIDDRGGVEVRRCPGSAHLRHHPGLSDEQARAVVRRATWLAGIDGSAAGAGSDEPAGNGSDTGPCGARL